MQVYIGLGSNQGDRFAALKSAVIKLSSRLQQITCSSVYSSPALLMPGSPAEWNIQFLNMAIRAETDLEPEQLLTFCKKIETKMGRAAVYPKWSPRIIDIDILLYGDLQYRSDTLTIPHSDMHERAFVLLPLIELGYSATASLGHSTTRIGKFL